jgi:hypothetical protein
MQVLSEIPLWRCGAFRCVMVSYGSPPGVALQVFKAAVVVSTVPCEDPDCAARDGEKLFKIYCDSPPT